MTRQTFILVLAGLDLALRERLTAEARKADLDLVIVESPEELDLQKRLAKDLAQLVELAAPPPKLELKPEDFISELRALPLRRILPAKEPPRPTPRKPDKFKPPPRHAKRVQRRR